MHKFVVRQPIKTDEHKLVGNELVFNVENELYNQNVDYSAAETISAFLSQNTDKIDKEAKTFITFTPNLLFKNIPKMFKADELVIQIEDNVITHPLAQKMVLKYKEAGYQIAINDFQFLPRYFGFLEYTDYIKIDVKSQSDETVDNILRMARGFDKLCIATNIDTEKLYIKALSYGFDYYEGPYVAEAAIIKANKVHYMKSNFFQLVIAVTKEIPDVDELEQIIERDASLTYRLLRIVNSAHFALRYKTSSVKQAIVVLGIEQLKKWVYLLSFDRDAEEDAGAEDMLKISLLRATFCSELLYLAEKMPITKSEAYLMGMFSTMTMMVNASMEEILSHVPLNETIYKALVKKDGKCAVLLDLVKSYEKADWTVTNKCAEILGIPANSIAQVYFDSVENVNAIWRDLQEYQFDEAELEEVAEALKQETATE